MSKRKRFAGDGRRPKAFSIAQLLTPLCEPRSPRATALSGRAVKVLEYLRGFGRHTRTLSQISHEAMGASQNNAAIWVLLELARKGLVEVQDGDEFRVEAHVRGEGIIHGH